MGNSVGDSDMESNGRHSAIYKSIPVALLVALDWSTVNSRYKHTVGTSGDMLIANICLYGEKITPC